MFHLNLDSAASTFQLLTNRRQRQRAEGSLFGIPALTIPQSLISPEGKGASSGQDLRRSNEAPASEYLCGSVFGLSEAVIFPWRPGKRSLSFKEGPAGCASATGSTASHNPEIQ